MIRHSSSLFLSLVFHTLLAFTIFLAYKTIFFIEKKVEKEKRLKVQLCQVQTQENKIIKKSVPVQKIAKPIIKTKPIKRQTTKPKSLAKKVPVKKIKTPPNVKAKKTPPKIIKETKPKIIPITEIIEQVTAQEEPIIVETKQEKNKRLEKQYIDNNIQKIRTLLSENLYYPRSARKRGITGVVIVKFRLLTSATVHDISVLSSNNEILSRAAIETIKNSSGAFPQPQEELILHVPIEYKLRR